MNDERGTAVSALSRHGEEGRNIVAESSIPAADVEAVAVPASSDSRGGLAIGIVAIIALVTALYLARAFFVPLLIGILASYALHPVVDLLKARHVPRWCWRR